MISVKCEGEIFLSFLGIVAICKLTTVAGNALANAPETHHSDRVYYIVQGMFLQIHSRVNQIVI